MSNLTLFQELEELLQPHSQYTSENGVMLKNSIVEAALQLRPDLLKLILTNEKLKTNFFTEVDCMSVFDKVRFQKFVMNKRFLPDSYTSFKNKIGLTTNEGDFLAESREVVLSWPYKDCVLEGGQTKEDAKRNEVFWNEILAPDEINRLTEPKVLTNFKKFDADGEHEVESISKADNLIIKGNNLLALHSLKKKYAGQVKLIYIDPPYNTGNDSFQYNDNFNHSTWLTFMRNRLEVSKKLLREDGTMAISIDQNEIAYCLVLMDEVFGKENRKNIITVKRSSVSGAKVINPGVVNVNEFLILYSKNTNSWMPNKVFREKERDERYNTFITNYEDDPTNWKYCSALEAFSRSLNIQKSKLKSTLGNEYEIKLENFFYENKDRIIRFAGLDDNSISTGVKEMKYVSKKDISKTYIFEREKHNTYYLYNGNAILFFKDRLIKIDDTWRFGEMISDIWDDVLPNDIHNEGGVTLRKGKKPEKFIARIIELTTEENDLIVDYHLGSGTTAAVAHKIGRRYIGIEQLDYGENDSVVRLQNVIGDVTILQIPVSNQGALNFNGEPEPEIIKRNYDLSGITKTVNWQGGGSFVYCELAKANQEFADNILASENKEELAEIWKQMQETGFLSWKVNPKTINENAEDVASLSVEDTQKFLLEALDKNLLYIPYSEIDNQEFAISENDKQLNAKFYGKA